MSDIEVSEIYGIMESIDDLSVGQLRLLETEYALIVPVNETIRFLVTSDDVLHC
jgi:heme/copper-type cytochrome/quinol oxidase subunit 2